AAAGISAAVRASAPGQGVAGELGLGASPGAGGVVAGGGGGPAAGGGGRGGGGRGGAPLWVLGGPPRQGVGEGAGGVVAGGCGVEQSQVARGERYLMKEVAEARGLNPGRLYDNWRNRAMNPISVTGGVFLCDYDRNGRIDVLITDVHGYMLYHGSDGGKFQD